MPEIRLRRRNDTIPKKADELVFLDITASSDRRDIVTRMVRAVADRIFIPFTVGGGLRTLEDIQAILQGGRRQSVFEYLRDRKSRI